MILGLAPYMERQHIMGVCYPTSFLGALDVEVRASAFHVLPIDGQSNLTAKHGHKIWGCFELLSMSLFNPKDMDASSPLSKVP